VLDLVLLVCIASVNIPLSPFPHPYRQKPILALFAAYHDARSAGSSNDSAPRHAAYASSPPPSPPSPPPPGSGADLKAIYVPRQPRGTRKRERRTNPFPSRLLMTALGGGFGIDGRTRVGFFVSLSLGWCLVLILTSLRGRSHSTRGSRSRSSARIIPLLPLRLRLCLCLAAPVLHHPDGPAAALELEAAFCRGRGGGVVIALLGHWRLVAFVKAPGPVAGSCDCARSFFLSFPSARFVGTGVRLVIMSVGEI
jgi:hypothetical protein